MALATRCPACSTVFRISTAQAAAKGGMVRCGHCHNVFNSLDALVRVEDLEIVDEASLAPLSGGLPDAVAGAPATDVAAEAAAEKPGEPGITGVLAGPSAPPAPDTTIREWWMPAQPRDARSTRVSMATATPTATATTTTTRSDTPAAPPDRPRDEPALAAVDANASWSAGTGSIGDALMQRPDARDASPDTARWTWAALSVVAAALLTAQLVYLWRDEIAVGWPPARAWLVAACRPLDCVVDYPAHGDAVTIESASVQTAATGANLYVLNALLRNRDATAVRYPHLELTLTDTNDRPVLRRVLRPEDYLAALRDGDERAGPAFAAQSELAIHVTFELNLRFAGYRLDRFYP